MGNLDLALRGEVKGTYVRDGMRAGGGHLGERSMAGRVMGWSRDPGQGVHKKSRHGLFR